MCIIVGQWSIEAFLVRLKLISIINFVNHQVQGYHELKTISVKQARVILHNVIPKKVRKANKDMQ